MTAKEVWGSPQIYKYERKREYDPGQKSEQLARRYIKG